MSDFGVSDCERLVAFLLAQWLNVIAADVAPVPF